jgi:hypothetical protein
MTELQGKRVDDMDAVWDGEPGCYYAIKNDEGQITGLWFKLPTGGLGRIASIVVGKDPEHEWTITENDDGTITVDPSIEQHATPGRTEPEYGYWHGHLVNGVWKY